MELDGFSISTPAEPGWHVWQKAAHAASLGKFGSSADETYGIQVWVIGLPEFYSDESFVNHVANGLKKEAEGPRFIELKSHASIRNTKHGACVEFSGIQKDLQAVKRTSNPEPMLLEMMGLTCRYPKRRSEAAHLIFSHRYYSGHQDLLLPEKAEALFDSLEFN